MLKRPGPTYETVSKLLSYNPKTGDIRWKEGCPRGRVPGQIAGTKDKHGFVRIHINRQSYSAQRLAILIVTGTYPLNQVHFENENRSDLRLDNLICGDPGYVRKRDAARLRSERLKWDYENKAWAVLLPDMDPSYYSSYADAATAYNTQMAAGKREDVNEFGTSAQYVWI